MFLYATASDGRGRSVAAFLLILLLVVLPLRLRADDGDDDFVVRTRCQVLTPWDFEYWFLGCEFLPSSGR